MRLFIALNFDDPVVNTLVDMQNELIEGGIQGKRTPPENLHLTLAFIGEYGSPDEVLDVMETLPFRPFSIRFDGFQHFRDMYFLRIAESEELSSYVRRLRHSMADAGIPFDRKNFKPHITMFRKVSFREDGIIIPPEVPDMSIEVRSVSLMRSTQGKRGMIYTEIGSIDG